jgi:hypothetical protein
LRNIEGTVKRLVPLNDKQKKVLGEFIPKNFLFTKSSFLTFEEVVEALMKILTGKALNLPRQEDLKKDEGRLTALLSLFKK